MSWGRPGELYGLLAEFDSAEKLLEAIRGMRRAGYKRINAYTPHPIEEVWEALGHHRSWLPLIVLVGGIVGCLGGFGLQYWAAAISYPLNIGGRPLNSWPAFIPVTFETTILVAGFAAVLGMLALNGLPRPHHPVFSVPRFALASRDRYFLMVQSRDELFDRSGTETTLSSFNPVEVNAVDF